MEILPNNPNSFQTNHSALQGTTLNSDYETFLKMLTVQMTNQDPLNPVESSDYAVQLATFSSVEQQVLTNDLLAAVYGQMASFGMSQLAGWVGMDVRTTAPVPFSGDPIDVQVEPVPAASRTEFVVSDENGEEVARIEIPVGSEDFSWDGSDENGATLPQGTYGFHTESFANTDELVASNLATTFGRVVEASVAGGLVQLVLAGGAVVNTAEVVGLRDPGEALPIAEG